MRARSGEAARVPGSRCTVLDPRPALVLACHAECVALGGLLHVLEDALATMGMPV